MQRVIQLAQMGKFSVAPNPRVGAVIVYKNRIIGEGYHQNYGEAHAEVNAVASVSDPSLLSESTIYVNLEPCAHHGKTPPCAELLVKHQFKRVVISNKDPFEKVDGNGISILEKAGIKVSVGCLQNEGYQLNRRFFTFHQQKRPYVILKWAETKDGLLSRQEKDITEKNNWITNEQSKQLVHQWRAEEDAILVGKNTARVDNPELTVRELQGKNPVRFVIDEHLELSKDLKLFNLEARTVVINQSKNSFTDQVHYLKNDSREGFISILNSYCYKHQIQSIIIEGGAKTLQYFIDSNSWDEARIFIGNGYFIKGLPAPKVAGRLIERKRIDSDELSIYQNCQE